MTVAELIKHLQTFPPEMRVIITAYSEYEILDAWSVSTCGACVARPDGWVPRERPDKAEETYVLIG